MSKAPNLALAPEEYDPQYFDLLLNQLRLYFNQVDIGNTVPNGGTGATSFTAGQILYGAGTSALATSANLTFDPATNTFKVASGSVATVNITNGTTYGNWNLVSRGVGYGLPSAALTNSDGDKIVFQNASGAKTGHGTDQNNSLWVQATANALDYNYSLYNAIANGAPYPVMRCYEQGMLYLRPGSQPLGGLVFGAVGASSYHGRLYESGTDTWSLGYVYYNTYASATPTPVISYTAAGNVTVKAALKTGSYTVATLPAGTTGMRVHVTDALAPAFLTALVGGGAVVCPAFYNGTAWVAG